MIHIVENEIGKNIPYQVIKRRQGDIAEYYANVDKVFQMLGWKSKRTLPESLRNTWKYTQNMIDS
jgi:UDP-glucose 4-epimerase